MNRPARKSRQTKQGIVAPVLPALWLAAVLAACPLLTAASQHAPELPDVPVNGLQMSISHATASGNPLLLTVTFRNLTTHKMAVLLGSGCVTIQRKINAVKVSVTAPDRKTYRNLARFPVPAGCAGGFWTFSPILEPGGSGSFPLDLDDYFTPSGWKGARTTDLPAGTYIVQAELETAPPSPYAIPQIANLWVGSITSNTLSIRIDKPFSVWQP